MFIPNHQENFTPEIDNAIEANDACMAGIAEILIHPMKDNLTLKQMDHLGLIAEVMRTIAEKAHAYEKLQESSLN